MITEHQTLSELRKAHNLTDQHMAELLGMTSAKVLKLEKESDFLLATFRENVEALGGTLSLIANVPDRASEVLES